jgi:hypothetical protein
MLLIMEFFLQFYRCIFQLVEQMSRNPSKSIAQKDPIITFSLDAFMS